MVNVLVPIDPARPERTRAAVSEAIQLCARRPARVHLLSVQPLVSGHVAMCFPPGELRRIQEEAGAQELAPVRTLLEAAGLTCNAHVHVGRRAETIARVARELQCATILMGPAQGGAGSLFGSVATQVRQLMGADGDCQVIG